MNKRYVVILTQSAYEDMNKAGDYIAENFKYEQYVMDFVETVEKGVNSLSLFPFRLTKTGFVYRNLDIYMKPHKKLLFFVTINNSNMSVYILRILHQGMDWKNIIQKFVY